MSHVSPGILCTTVLTIGLSWTSSVSAAGCPGGAYGPGDGDFVVVTSPASLPPPAQRYLFRDGRRGSTADADSLVRCENGALMVSGKGGRATPWLQLAMSESDSTFSSHGTRLVGRLIEPESAKATAPLVVMVHGSERTSATRSPYAYALAAQGVRVLPTTSAASANRRASTPRTSSCWRTMLRPHLNTRASWPPDALAAPATSAAVRADGSRRWQQHDRTQILWRSDSGWWYRPSKKTANKCSAKRVPRASQRGHRRHQSALPGHGETGDVPLQRRLRCIGPGAE